MSQNDLAKLKAIVVESSDYEESNQNTDDQAFQRENDFLDHRNPYQGLIRRENLVFNANLQDFAQKISYICNLETGGKIHSDEAYKQIKALWKKPKHRKKELRNIENLEGGQPPESIHENG